MATLEETKEELLRAVAEVVAESEQRTEGKLGDLRAEVAKLRTDIAATEARITEKVSTSESHLRSDLNDMEQRILAAIDRLANPPA